MADIDHAALLTQSGMNQSLAQILSCCNRHESRPRSGLLYFFFCTTVIDKLRQERSLPRAIRDTIMSKAHSSYIYIPAFSYDTIRFGCDPLARRALREAAIDDLPVEQGRVEKGQRVLDLGCGAASLALLIKKIRPGADVIGIDGDKTVLEIAEERAREQHAVIPRFDAMAFDIPCRDNYFDRIFSGMLFHHHATKDKIRTAKEIYRIRKPGGELHVADFGRPQNALMAHVARIMRTVDFMGICVR